MNIFLVDGTYELFRHFFAVPKVSDVNGQEVGAIRGVLGSMLSLLENDVSHIGVATDHVVESFRNDLWGGYKTGHGIDPELFQQFHPLEEALQALGLVVWKEVEFEADDALASAASKLPMIRELNRCLFAPRIRTLRSVSTVDVSCNLIGGQRRYVMRKECVQNLV